MARVISRGSVVLVSFPFSDLTGTKIRPAIVLMSNRLISKVEDILCLFISSSMPKKLLSTDLILSPDHPVFPQTGLKHSSVIRSHKITLLHKSLIRKTLGEVDSGLFLEINKRIKLALELN